jgi:hypothetical protein
MDSPDCLAHYSFVVTRIACRVCSRGGSYRLARLAAKYGPEITLRDLTDRFSNDCLWRAEARSKKGKSACGVYLPDLEATFSTGASTFRATDIALLLSIGIAPPADETFTVSLEGGVPLADVSFDPVLGLNVGPGGPALASVTLPASDLSAGLIWPLPFIPLLISKLLAVQ